MYPWMTDDEIIYIYVDYIISRKCLAARPEMGRERALFASSSSLSSSLSSTSLLFLIAMVKLSLPTWDRDKSQFQAGTSFTPSFAGRLKPSSTPTTTSLLRRFKSTDSAVPSQPASHPLMTLRLSSPSFLDSFVHDGSSDNPLYVIDTDSNVTKVRRSDQKGFVNVSRVRWPADRQKPSSMRKTKDLTGVEVVFGKGSWKPANEFLGSSLSKSVLPLPLPIIADLTLYVSYRKFYIPHHPHSLRWKRLGSHYAVRRCQSSTST
jgi:hypothetical protein